MKLAVMQPYFFPYLGYFQLVQSVDHFVFYDDVNYIKRGWINRNRILINDSPSYFTVPLVGVSRNKLINEIDIAKGDKALKKGLISIAQNYKSAPFFNGVYHIVEEVYQSQKKNIAEWAGLSVTKIAEYLGLSTTFHFSSELDFGHNTSDRAERLIEICKGFEAKIYINAAGGKELYKKEEFAEHGIDLKFIDPILKRYPQRTNEFIPGLSFIDVLMNNSKDDILEMLAEYSLT